LSNLRKLTAGVGWGAVSVATITVLQLALTGVMARLLEPKHFGLLAIANISLRFFSYFAQMGIVPALIQKPLLTDDDIRAALAVSLAVSVAFFLLAFASAWPIERFFKIEELAPVMRILATNFIVAGFSSIPLALMRRTGAFRALAMIEIVSYVCGYGLIGLCAAYYGAGVWALVAAFMTQTFLSAVLSYAVVRCPVGLKHTKAQRNHFIRYGGRYSLIGFVEFLSSNVDALIIGKLLGATPAGYYNRAFLLANLPVQQPANVLTRALFPIMSSMADHHEKQSMSLQLSILLVGSYAFAVGGGIYVAAPDIVKVLLGDKWSDAVPILQVLAWSVGPLYVSHVAGVTLDSMAQLAIKMRIQLAMFGLLVLLLLLTATSGKVVSIAIAVVVTEWVRVCIMVWVLVRLLEIPAMDAAKIVISVATVAITTGLSIFMFHQFTATGVSSIIRLLTEAVGGVIGVLIGLVITLFVVSRHPAAMYLASRQPQLAKLLPK
jgi:lipopolysaccharide exporter